MASPDACNRRYDRLVQAARHRKSHVHGRSLEEEFDADHGRVLFCPAFRRLQDKAQVFSLERNAAVRSRLTHSLEVSSIGRYVAQQALKAFPLKQQKELGLLGKSRAIITLVETACLLHDIGNPPFGHFGEQAISNWFHQHAGELVPEGLGPAPLAIWEKYFKDFTHFDGNPQGFRIVTKLQAKEVGDLCGLNLTAATLASLIKYPWTTDALDKLTRKKPGYFQTEQAVVEWIGKTLGLPAGHKYPFAYVMEAADDIAYCLSDIEDGIEKGLVSPREFAGELKKPLKTLKARKKPLRGDEADIAEMRRAICDLEGVVHDGNRSGVKRFSGMEHLRGSFVRHLARHAGVTFYNNHSKISTDNPLALLHYDSALPLLEAVKHFAQAKLYSSSIVRDRELTANAVLSGLLTAYRPVMTCDRDRFARALRGSNQDSKGRLITGEQALSSRLPTKCIAVYNEEVRQLDDKFGKDTIESKALERIHRIHMIVDYISGMTDDFALRVYKLVAGIDTMGHAS